MTKKMLGRSLERLFYLLLIALSGVATVFATPPTMTTISDVVYRANGQPAAGTIVVSWPAFNTADNKPVAAGVLSIPIGTEGTVNFALVPNEGGDPGGTYYKAIYKLTDGTTFTEYWVVPAASPTTVAAIRASVVPRQVGAQFVNRQYVDTAVATTHDQVVHKAGSETIAGIKSFSASPEVPTPASGAAAVNKDYVTGAVSAISDGFVDKSGDTMNGPLTVPDDPAAPGHATNRQYVDTEVSGVATTLNLKLARSNDTPVNLASVRYANQFAPGQSLSEQVDAACSDLSGAMGTVVMPAAMEATGLRSMLPDNCHVADDRRTSGPNHFGTETTTLQKGLVHRMRWTAPNSDVANGSTSSGQTFHGLQVFVDAAKGGINNGTLGATTKSNYRVASFTLNASTPGQHTAVEGTCIKFSAGDCFGVVGFAEMWGGSRPGVGDEASVPISSRFSQGTTIFSGTISAKSGNTLTFASTLNANTLGAGSRWMLNKTTGVYAAGTAQFTVGTTVNGFGTSWTSLGAASDYCFSLDAEEEGGRKFVIPVESWTDDTHLVLAMAPGTFMSTTAGTYKLYKCSEVAEVSVDKTSTTPSTPPTATLVSASGFAITDQVELPLSPMWAGVGVKIVMSPQIATTRDLTGLSISNLHTGASKRIHNAIVSSGNFRRGLEFNGGTIRQTYGILWNAMASPEYLLLANDTADSAVIVHSSISRRAATGGEARFTYFNSTDQWALGSNTSGLYNFKTTAPNMGIGTAGLAGTALHVVPAAAEKGVVINGNASSDVLDVQVASASKFKVAGDGGVTAAGTIAAAGFTGPLTGAVNGNASTAATLQTARTINSVSFNGSANITVTAELPTDPSACGANQLANDIAADGTLSCVQPAYSGISGTPTLYNQTVQDEGSGLTQRATLNFVGAGVSCADDTTKTTCTISGGGAGGDSITVATIAAADPDFVDFPSTGTEAGVDFGLDTTATPDTISGKVAAASATVAGVVTTGAQTFAGVKTFSSTIVGNIDTATTLAANPADCASGEYAHTIAASGNLTCSKTPGYLISLHNAFSFNPADATTYYIGGVPAAFSAWAASSVVKALIVAKACTVTTVNYAYFVNGTAPSSHTGDFYIAIGTSAAETSTFANQTGVLGAGVGNASVTGLSQALAAGDYIAIKFVSPTWTTNPTSVIIRADIYCE